MPNERRLQERFQLELKARVSYRFIDDVSEEAIETVAANISSGGAFLHIGSPLPLSSKVQIEFLIPVGALKKLKFILPMETLKSLTGEQVWIKTTGIVIRRQENGVGVIFDQNYQLTPILPADDIQSGVTD